MAFAALYLGAGFQRVRLEGRSMAPTLENEDRLLVNRVAYVLAAPRRGDIVMLWCPEAPTRRVVKRVIAAAGDTLEIVDGTVVVNGHSLREDYIESDYRDHDRLQRLKVPRGFVFVLGDHRNDSSDSRDWGVVSVGEIIGKVDVRWWPLQQWRVF